MSEEIDAINLWELEVRARELLPKMGYDYYASGANDEITLRENRAAYERITLLPRMLVDVSVRDMSTTVLGEPVSMPILIAPTALQGLAHPEGVEKPGSSTFWRCCARNSIWPWRCRAAQASPPSPEILSVF
jgi:4-hydroxymandelate oxidase